MTKILFIDDNPSLQKVMVLALKKAGYEVMAADDGKKGLALCHEHKPDLVIADLIMPDMDGVEMISELKKQSLDVKIIAISGGGEEGSGEEYLESAEMVLDVQHTIAKPFEPDQLLELVKEVLGNS